MIDAHKTLIGRCAPLAKMVVEMVALKNLTRDPLPDIRLPIQLLLNTVHGRILDASRDSCQVHVRTAGRRPSSAPWGAVGLFQRGIECVLGSYRDFQQNWRTLL